ncbi:hypothetical protein GQR36_03795 [Enterococcus termitis]
MNVAQVIDIEQVLIDLEGTTQLEVIEQLADCLDKKAFSQIKQDIFKPF